MRRIVHRGVRFTSRPVSTFERTLERYRHVAAVWEGGKRGGTVLEQDGRFYAGSNIGGPGMAFEDALNEAIRRRASAYHSALWLVEKYEDEELLLGPVAPRAKRPKRAAP